MDYIVTARLSFSESGILREDIAFPKNVDNMSEFSRWGDWSMLSRDNMESLCSGEMCPSTIFGRHKFLYEGCYLVSLDDIDSMGVVVINDIRWQ